MDSRRIAELANPNWKQARRDRYSRFEMPKRADVLHTLHKGRMELINKLRGFDMSYEAIIEVCNLRSFLVWLAWPELDAASNRSPLAAAKYLFSNIIQNVSQSPYMDWVGKDGNTYIYNATTQEVAVLIVSISRMTRGEFDFDKHLTIIKL